MPLPTVDDSTVESRQAVPVYVKNVTVPSSGTDATAANQVLEIAQLTTLNGKVPAAATLADGLALGSTHQIAAANLLYNGTTLDLQRGNIEGTALASAARTASTNSADITNHNCRGVFLFFNLTSVPGGDTVQLTIEGKDPVSGSYGQIWATTATASTLLPGRYVLYPGVSGTANVTANTGAVMLPRTWRVRVVHSAGTSFTYSVGYSLII